MGHFKRLIKRLTCPHRSYELFSWEWTHGPNGMDPGYVVADYRCSICGKQSILELHGKEAVNFAEKADYHMYRAYQWYEEPVRHFVQEYLAKDNTVSWGTVDISERDKDDGARLSVSPGKADPEDGEQSLQANGECQTAGGVQRWYFSCQIDPFGLP